MIGFSLFHVRRSNLKCSLKILCIFLTEAVLLLLLSEAVLFEGMGTIEEEMKCIFEVFHLFS